MSHPEYFKVVTVAEVFQISRRAVREMCRKGELRAYNFGGPIGWRIAASSVENLRRKFDAQQNGQNGFDRR